jgi:hypothetical protein
MVVCPIRQNPKKALLINIIASAHLCGPGGWVLSVFLANKQANSVINKICLLQLQNNLNPNNHCYRTAESCIHLIHQLHTDLLHLSVAAEMYFFYLSGLSWLWWKRCIILATHLLMLTKLQIYIIIQLVIAFVWNILEGMSYVEQPVLWYKVLRVQWNKMFVAADLVPSLYLLRTL